MAKKGKQVEESSEETAKLKSILAGLEKNFGKGVIQIITGPASTQKFSHQIPSGSISLDIALGSMFRHASGVWQTGYPPGRIIEIFGEEGCVAGGTRVNFQVRSLVGKRMRNSKGGTIARLYERFHGLRVPGQGNYHRPNDIAGDNEFFAPSINEEGRIIQNRILDVLKTGVKSCYRLTTITGMTIVATADHKFWNGQRFVALSDLMVGDIVYIHNGTHYQDVFAVERRLHRSRQRGNADLYVKHHPIAGVKIIDGKYKYHRLAKARAVVEAKMNDITFDSYLGRLNTGMLDGMRFLAVDQHVHHIDEDVTNNTVENLVVIDGVKHNRMHACKCHNNMRFAAVADKVKSIVADCERETYDICMESPYNNYVADGLVVHNSGKSTACLQMVANAQALGIRCAYGDMEHAVDPDYARALGVDLSKLYLFQPQSGTQCLQIAATLLKSGSFGLIVIDSVAALISEAELKGEIGDSHVAERARLMAQALTDMNTYLSSGPECNLVFTNQVRDKIGGYGGKTTPGGRALKFFASVRIELYRMGMLKENETAMPYGQRVGANIIKNKSAPPFRKVEFDLVFGKGIDCVADLFELCVGRGLITANGSWYSFGQRGQVQGKNSAVELLRSDQALCYGLYDQLLTRVMMERGLDPDGSMIPGVAPPPPPSVVAKTFQPIAQSAVQPKEKAA